MTEFGTLDLEEMSLEGQRLSSPSGTKSFQDQFVPMPEVKPGQKASIIVRILPPVKGGKLYQYNRTHKLNGRSIHCPRPLDLAKGSFDRSVYCPICEYYSSLWNQMDKLKKAGHTDQWEALNEEQKKVKPVERYYYNAIIRSLMIDGKESKNVGPRILSIGKDLHSKLIRAMFGDKDDPEVKLGNFTDVKAGYDFVIRKEVTLGGDNYPRYTESSFSRNPSPLGSPEELAKWVQELHDLTKLRNPKDGPYLEKELAIHRGLIQDETQGFNTDSFDAKWRSQQQAEVAEVLKHPSAQVQVTTNLTGVVNHPNVLEATPEVAPAAPVVPASEDLSIEDKDFLAELEAMNNG